MTEPWVLRTERLGFRWWTGEDIPLALALWCNADVTHFIGGPFSEKYVRERLAREMAAAAEHRLQYWPVFRLEDGAHAGVCGMRPDHQSDAPYALGVHLHKEFWGSGYASEACRRVIAYAFDELEIPSLFAGHHPNNEGSRRLLASLGFQSIGTVHYPPTGLMHPSYVLKRGRPDATPSAHRP